jgi:hypothetical protein
MNAYFLCANVNRRVAGVIFEPISSSGGTSYGVYQTSDESEATALRAATTSASGVEEISEAQYVSKLKKKPSVRPRVMLSESKPPAIMEKVGVVVEEPALLPEPTPVEPESPDSVIQVGLVDPVGDGPQDVKIESASKRKNK